MAQRSKKLYFAVAIPLVALGLSLMRWTLQGTSNVYSKLNLRPYVPDEVLGWRKAPDPQPWLGLDAIGIVSGIAIAVLIAAWWTLRRENKTRSPWKLGRATAITIAVGSFVFPVWSFHRGLPPAGAREVRPENVIEAPETGIEGSLSGLPAGMYRVRNTDNIALAAKLKAGGEEFEAAFTGLEGFWRGDPADLTQPSGAEISADATTVATGIELRNKHAREKLHTDKHSRISFKLTELVAVEGTSPSELTFRSKAQVEIGARVNEVEVVGKIRRVDKSLGEQLKLGPSPAMYIEARFELNLAETIVGNDGTFDEDVVPILANIVLQYHPQQ